MTDLSNPCFCFFCQRKFREGEGRYRFYQKEKEVECCPSCYDETRAFLPRLLGEQDGKRSAGNPEKESKR